ADTSPSTFLAALRSDLRIRVLSRPDPRTLVFELVGVDASFANALRRIMIAEIPTVALEYIYMWNNTGLIHDEVLSHRLGLVPLNVDPRLFDEYGLDVDENGEAAATDRNTVVFRLNVACGRNEREDERLERKMEERWRNEGLVRGLDPKKANKGGEQEEGSGSSKKKKSKNKKNKKGKAKNEEGAKEEDEEEVEEEDEEALEPSVMGLSIADKAASHAAVHAASNANVGTTIAIDEPSRPFTKHIYTHHLLWCPQGDQLERFPLHNDDATTTTTTTTTSIGGIRPIHEDILLAKLRPGQVIELEAHARKGTGKDHAKFSPVATASYRLMPQIEITRPIYDDDAEELVNWFEPGVFSLLPIPSDAEGEDAGHRVKAAVSNPYACTMSRNFMRHPVLKERIKMSRIPNHFIFEVESVGMMAPGVIVAEALKVLKEKCERVVGLADESLAAMMGGV
ncbi:hypothetical protein ACHAXS_004487, partial [Conticribra weissflogii]